MALMTLDCTYVQWKPFIWTIKDLMKVSKRTAGRRGGTASRKRTVISECDTETSSPVTRRQKKLVELMCASCLPMAFSALIKVLDKRDEWTFDTFAVFLQAFKQKSADRPVLSLTSRLGDSKLNRSPLLISLTVTGRIENVTFIQDLKKCVSEIVEE